MRHIGHEFAGGTPPLWSFGFVLSGRTGNVKANVDPWPAGLWTQIRPPCSSRNFARWAGTRPRKQEGTGLGLTLAKKFVEDGRLILGRNPDPVSLTTIVMTPSATVAARPTRPASGVNSTALESRFSRIRLTFRLSLPFNPSRCSEDRLRPFVNLAPKDTPRGPTCSVWSFKRKAEEDRGEPH